MPSNEVTLRLLPGGMAVSVVHAAAAASPIPDWYASRSPGARRAVEHAGATGVALVAIAVGVQVPSRNLRTIASDQRLLAIMAVGGLTHRIMHIPGEGVTDAVSHRDRAAPR